MWGVNSFYVKNVNFTTTNSWWSLINQVFIEYKDDILEKLNHRIYRFVILCETFFIAYYLCNLSLGH